MCGSVSSFVWLCVYLILYGEFLLSSVCRQTGEVGHRSVRLRLFAFNLCISVLS